MDDANDDGTDMFDVIRRRLCTTPRFILSYVFIYLTSSVVTVQMLTRARAENIANFILFLSTLFICMKNDYYFLILLID